MPTLVIDGVSFTPQEARDAIYIRDWLAGVKVEGHACPPLDGMSDVDAMHWLITAVTNAKAQREKYAPKRNTD